MMNFFSTNKKLGILGGGQLGKMILYTTRKWDIYTFVMDPKADAPARLACDQFVVGDLMNFDSVINFGSKLDILTIEIENVNVKALYELEKKGVKVYPQPSVLEVIQNKSKQKNFYKKKNIPTSNFKTFSNIESLKNSVAKGNLSYPFVWKAASMGYDGYGVSVIKNNKDLESLNDCECIIEDLVSIKSELSVIVARRINGEVKTFPVVEMEFHPNSNQVEFVICPARISSRIRLKAEKLAIEVSEKFKHIGILAVEMFLTETDEIIVNEVAPRPHNSGHLTIESSYTCQFEQHIRSILDLPLGSPINKIPAVMVNLVGKHEYFGPVIYKNIDQILVIDGVTPHIYGKKQTHPNRKMGHVTITNKNLKEAIRIGKQVKSIIEVISS
tara:strand:- start:883 stop:2040 length:1158 start_codon:yes stop_codon:yes gene_type:complete